MRYRIPHGSEIEEPRARWVKLVPIHWAWVSPGYWATVNQRIAERDNQKEGD